jgi:hypothetical protein
VALIWILACGGPGVAEPPLVEAPVSDEPAEVLHMDATALLTRASLDLRGVRPSVEEIELVEADPQALEALIEAFIEDPRFGDRVRDLYGEIYLTQQDSWYVTAAMVDQDDEPLWAYSVGQEPLRLVEQVATQDLPWTELVVGDWTMANEPLLAAWPLRSVDEAEGWRVAEYTDGRPAAGVLSTNALWWRYSSNASNANRGRANAISKMLLCTDYLSKPITFERDVDLLDQDAIDDALANNPGCVACHYSLDPLASYLWGFYYYDYQSAIDTAHYHPERELLYEDYGDIEPGYFGEPGSSLADLGEQLAADPRFAECAVEQAMELLLQRELLLEDQAEFNRHRKVFLEQGLRLKPLWLSVVASDAYRAAPGQEAERLVPAKLVSVELLTRQVEDLTGYRFTYAGYDMMSTDTYGLRTLAGGVDGNFVTRPASEPMTTMVLVQERLAQGAAWYVVEQDRAAEAPSLFTEIDFSETPETNPEPMVRQIQALHLRVFGDRVASDGPEVQANLELWSDLYGVDGDPEMAWAGLLSVLLRDPHFLVY